MVTHVGRSDRIVAVPAAGPRRAALALLTIGLLGSASITTSVHAEASRLEVRPDQTATVVGTFDSLAAVVARLCRAAGAELRAFNAADRTVTVDQVERPLSEVLARLLSRENYLLGVREAQAAGQPPRVVWVHVTGSKGGGVGDAGTALTVPSQFGARTFEEESVAATRRAQRAVADRLLADDRRVAQFLAVEAKELARSLREYPHIVELLRALRADQPREVAAKLDAVIHELETAAD